jgi:hypothetical protein
VESRDRVVVLTCTVTPAANVVVDQPQLRAKQYDDAIRSWRNTLSSDDGIIVVENSGFDLSINHPPSRNGPTLEFVSATGTLGFSSTLGKGYSEALMLQTALPLLENYRSVYKITGRLFVANFNHLAIAATSSEPWVQIRMRPSLDFADSRFFGADRDTFGQIVEELAPMINEPQGQWIEHALARQVLGVVGRDGVKFQRFRTSPHIVGISGSSGSQYGGAAWRVRRGLESMARKSRRLNTGMWI